MNATNYEPPEDPEVGSFPILFRDEHVVAIDKPPGIAVHRGSEWDPKRRYVLQMLHRQIDQYLYPVHRLDRATSGVLLFGLSKEDARGVMEQWGTDAVQKDYLAICRGSTPARFHSTRALSVRRRREKIRQPAFSEFETVYKTARLSVVRVRIYTGRHHQIRRHLASMGHHVLGDTTHGKGGINRTLREKYDLPRMCLHAERLTFPHPRTGKSVELYVPLRDDLREFVQRVRGVPDERIDAL